MRALAPLVSVRRLFLRHLEFPAASIVHEPSSFLYDGQPALNALLRALLATGAPLTLPRFNAGPCETAARREFLSKGCLRIDTSGASSLRVPLKHSWPEFESGLSSGRRSDLRRYRRRLEQHGSVEFEALEPDENTLEANLDELFRIEASGWKGQEGSAILCQPHIRRFYTHYARSASTLGMLRLFFLKVDGKAVAGRMAVEHGGRLWDLRLGYDEAWNRCAPGVVLTHETLRYAVEHGLQAYEFLGRAEPWERHWPCEEDHYGSMRVYPYSMKGQLSFLQDGGRVASRKAYHAAQASGRRILATTRGLRTKSAFIAMLMPGSVHP